MFIYYEGVRCPARYQQAFGVTCDSLGDAQTHPGGHGSFLRIPFRPEDEDNPIFREALQGRFGLRPDGVRRDADPLLLTYHAPVEQIAEDPLIHEAWSLHRHCLIPVESLVMADWRSGDETLVRIRHHDNRPMALGGLWLSELKDAAFEYSYAMLTVAPEREELLPYTPGPDSDRRIPVIVPEGAYDDWLDAPVKQSRDYMQPYPVDRLVVEPLDAWPDDRLRAA